MYFLNNGEIVFYCLSFDDVESTLSANGDPGIAVDVSVDKIEAKSVGRNSFRNLSGVRAVKLPEVVEAVKESAFENCGDLSVVEFSGSAAGGLTVQHDAFKNCARLESVIFPPAKKIVIEAGAFSNCRALRSIVFRKCKVEIRNGAFDGCDKNMLTFVAEFESVETYARENGFKYVFLAKLRKDGEQNGETKEHKK